jgi:hypothetical protein
MHGGGLRILALSDKQRAQIQDDPRPDRPIQKDPAMKKFLAVALLAAATAVSAAPASAQMPALKSLDTATTESGIVHKTGRRGRVAAGIVLGIVGAAIANHAYGYSQPDYEESWEERHERRCRRWRRACNRGHDRACWKYDDRC